MLAGDYVLDLCNVHYTGQVEPGKCAQRLLGSTKTGVILKDVVMTVHSGEVMAILGSKGSGKRAVLDVISRRAQGTARGTVLLNGVPLTLRLFQQRCGYVTQRCDLIPGLTVQQTLTYTPTILGGYMKVSKVKQVMADLALSQVAHKKIEKLTLSEYRRLVIGVQLVRDPVILLLDEPTWNLDPLNTYLIISILSNTAKNTGCGIVLSLEKPRSDVFPFLDRALYLCLGGVVYSGGTRAMLEYFHDIGYPCPRMENPLMYYLCLSTVDRRSRERFIESNQQIEALVDRFRQERIPGPSIGNAASKVTLAYGKPGQVKVIAALYMRLLSSIFSWSYYGFQQLFFRLFSMPLFFAILWIFYNQIGNFQRAFITKNGLVFNMQTMAYASGLINTVIIFPKWRTRYYQECQEGLYGGPALLFAWNLVSLPFSLIASIAATAIIYPLVCSMEDVRSMAYMVLSTWSCFIFSEQLTITILMIVKYSLNAAIFSAYILSILLTLSSGALRSFRGLPDWLQTLTYMTHTRYSSNVLYRLIFSQPSLTNLPYSRNYNCTNISLIETSNFNGQNAHAHCKYLSGSEFLIERFSRTGLIGETVLEELESDFNLGLSFAFAFGFIVLNKMLYTLPLPTFVKNRFRE